MSIIENIAPAIGHRGLTAAGARARGGTAAPGGQVVAGGVAVLQVAATLARWGVELWVRCGFVGLAAAALVGGLLGSVGFGEILGRHLRKGVEPVRALPAPAAATVAADQRKEPLQGKRAADHAVLSA